jgi:uncharacterized protein (TIGR03084 family)
MLEQAVDFEAECNAFYTLLEGLNEHDWRRETQFKRWTANDVLAHLHFFNYAADLALQDGDAFSGLMREMASAIKHGATHLSFTHAWLNGARDRELMYRWHEFYHAMARRFSAADPKRRVPWAGPSMSVRSSITARLMETWAHGQAVYDLAGEARNETDRIRNIAVLGINTFSWTFANRGLPVPASMPYVRLGAPSGTVWEWGQPDRANLVEGSAVEFSQVVTQVRNIADTRLQVSGSVATHWMSIAQCFAGRPEEPPPRGTRFMQTRIR